MANVFYTSNANALADVNGRQHNYIPYVCPFYFEEKSCGSWCALFEIAEHTRGLDGAKMRRVCLRCGDGQKVFAVIE